MYDGYRACVYIFIFRRWYHFWLHILFFIYSKTAVSSHLSQSKDVKKCAITGFQKKKTNRPRISQRQNSENREQIYDW